MSKFFTTPGVYIEEKNAFVNSIVPVSTNVPAFIGYTEKSISNKKDLKLIPTRISSYNEFLEHFGAAPDWEYTLEENTTDINKPYRLGINRSSLFILHSSIRLFFSNGGATCYIVSVGSYVEAKAGVLKSDLEKGLAPLLKETEPSILVIPEAVLIEDKNDCYSLQQAMLVHCGEHMKNRFAILDVWSDMMKMIEDEANYQNSFRQNIDDFRTGIGMNNLQWGAAYAPYLHTTVTRPNEINFTNISKNSHTNLINLLEKDLDQQQSLIGAEKLASLKEDIKKLASETNDEDQINNLHQKLWASNPLYKSILQDLRKCVNLLPPSGAMAGVYTMVDNNVGVHQSPANVGLGSVSSLALNITNIEQERLNIPIDGKAVNAIRTFPGKGVLVWGARTLDGNSQDWRYVSVRRTVIFIEQSIKNAIEAYVFEPNDVNTWNTVNAAITNFLTNAWYSGALAGATPEDAFSVRVGLGTTMTPQDILDGLMKTTVSIAVTRPAEFIVLNFEQQMQKS